MKKILLVLTLGSLLIVPAVALAACPDYTSEGPCEGAGCTWDDDTGECIGVEEIEVMAALGSIVNWLFAILLIVAALFIVVAAYHFVTAAGDPERAKTARNFVLYAVIGVIVGFAAKGLVALVERIVG